MVSGDLLDNLETTVCLHGVLGLQLVAVGESRLFIGGAPFQGRCRTSKANDEGCPEKPDHLTLRQTDRN